MLFFSKGFNILAYAFYRNEHTIGCQKAIVSYDRDFDGLDIAREEP